MSQASQTQAILAEEPTSMASDARAVDVLETAAGEPLLEAKGVGKIYSRNQGVTRARIAAALRQTLIGGRPGTATIASGTEFWALKDIDLSVGRGEALGIIGLNGSGKTTLLRILAGQIVPDAGVVRVRGRTSSMIDLTAGFQTSASGRTNIYLRGAALGRSRAEIDATIDEVIAFTELGDAIEAPVATYSAGMTMRLAFAIMVASVPDILFIDEVLAVGDFRFRQKCLAKLREIRERTSFVMVSHAMQDVRSFCSRAIVLDKGGVIFSGTPSAAVAAYELQRQPELKSTAGPRDFMGSTITNSAVVGDLSAQWCDTEGRAIETLPAGAPLKVDLAFRLVHAPRKLTIGIPVWSEAGVFTTGFSTEWPPRDFRMEAGQYARFRLDVPALLLNPGRYYANIAIMDGAEYLVRLPMPDLVVTQSAPRWWGLASMPYDWTEIPRS